MDREEFYGLVRETVSELNSIMKVSLKEQVKDLAKSALGRSVRAKDPMFWPAGMLMLGLVEAREIILDGTDGGLVGVIDAAIGKHVRLWKDGYGEKIDYIDDALSGAALIKLYGQKELGEELKSLCRQAADKICGYLYRAPRDMSGAIAYNAQRSGANVFADGIGQTSMFLSLYGSVFDDAKAVKLAREQLLAFKRYGCDERSGLPYHGYALKGQKKELFSKNDSYVNIQESIVDERIKEPAPETSRNYVNVQESIADERIKDLAPEAIRKGVLSWGRAAGWLIMGLSEYIKCCTEGNATVPEDHSDSSNSDNAGKALENELKLWYSSLSGTLMSYQRKTGGFAWQIQATEGPLDTSATGMIVYGLMNGRAEKCLGKASDFFDIDGAGSPEGFAEFIKPAVSAMEKSIKAGKVGSALSSCDDFGVHYQTYGHYPWGQGAVLAALSMVDRK